MKNVQKIIVLDFLAIKSYLTLKNFAIFFGFMLLYSFLNKDPIVVLYIMSFAAVLYASYPFFVGDESGIDALYKIFGLEAKNVVIGRYIFMYLMNLCAIAIGLIAYVLLGLILQKFVLSVDWLHLMIGIVSVFVVSTSMSLFQFPLFFKYGYAKGKLFTIMPILVLAILSSIVIGFFREDLNKLNLEAINPAFIISVIGVIYLVVLAISIRSSIYSYLKKEL